MAVYLASNQHGPQPEGTIDQFSKHSFVNVQVPCQDLVKRYNQGMGEVDLLDGSVAPYRVNWKKWWWSIFSCSLSVQVDNTLICI